MFALREDNCTAKNVLKLVEAEELGKSSVRDSKRLNDIQAVSAYRRIQRNHPTTPVYTPSPSTSRWQCWSCEQSHAKEAVCPAKKLKYTLCNRKGHMGMPQNSRGGQNLDQAEEVGDLLNLEATAAGEVCHVPSHATPKPTAWEDNACHSTGKNLLGPGEGVKAMVHTLPHKKDKCVQTLLPKNAKMF